AIPVAVLLYLFALAVNQQYRSWRGRTLVDLLLGLYSGIRLAAVLILAAVSVGNLGVHYSRLTIIYTVLLTVVLMTAERYLLRQIKLCEDQQLEFKVIPDLLDIMSTRTEVNAIDGLPIVGIRRSRMTGVNAWLKRSVDIAVCAVALAILALPLLLVALLVKL